MRQSLQVPTTSLSVVWNTRKLAAGAHQIKALARDAAGNVGAAEVTMYR